MKRRWIPIAVAALGAAALPAAAQSRADDYSFRVGRAPEWNLAAADGICRLRIRVDDAAQVQMRGDRIIVRTDSGKRSYDEGSVCNQPLPFHPVDDFRVTAEKGRGHVLDVNPPLRRNNFTGSVRIEDPQRGGDDYELVVAWRNPAGIAPPLASNDPYPYYDETRACQDRVRADFLGRNRDGDAYLEFTNVPGRDDLGADRERIRGEAVARSRYETRLMSYECVLNDRTNRVVTAEYELRARGRYGSLQ